MSENEQKPAPDPQPASPPPQPPRGPNPTAGFSDEPGPDPEPRPNNPDVIQLPPLPPGVPTAAPKPQAASPPPGPPRVPNATTGFDEEPGPDPKRGTKDQIIITLPPKPAGVPTIATFPPPIPAAAPDRISVTANPTFGELFVASLLLLRYNLWFFLLYCVFVLSGLFLLLTPFITGNRLSPIEIVLAMLAFSYAPLVCALSVWSAHRRNKLAKGPFTHSFDAEGMHTSGEAFSQTIRWSGVLRVRRSRRFLFIFIAPARAHCIPLRAITDPQFFDRLRTLAGGRTDFGPDSLQSTPRQR
ncbi:MAG TPA: YcxB family protein [Verrucomicrobiae bacterium]|nr:YcxB family protein [Verrucomicrobiae bacterium]